MAIFRTPFRMCRLSILHQPVSSCGSVLLQAGGNVSNNCCCSLADRFDSISLSKCHHPRGLEDQRRTLPGIKQEAPKLLFFYFLQVSRKARLLINANIEVPGGVWSASAFQNTQLTYFRRWFGQRLPQTLKNPNTPLTELPPTPLPELAQNPT